MSIKKSNNFFIDFLIKELQNKVLEYVGLENNKIIIYPRTRQIKYNNSIEYLSSKYFNIHCDDELSEVIQFSKKYVVKNKSNIQKKDIIVLDYSIPYIKNGISSQFNIENFELKIYIMINRIKKIRNIYIVCHK